MKSKHYLLFLLLLIVLLSLGFLNLRRIDKIEKAILQWQRDSAQHQLTLAKEENKMLEQISADNLIGVNNNPRQSSLAHPYLDASQGVEVHLEGVRWMGKWFDASRKNGISSMGGLAEVQINQLVFDPDFEKAGLPDLNVEVTSPRFFEMNHFLRDWLSGFKLGGSLGTSFGGAKPLETYNLKTSSGKRQKMEHWLLAFDVFLRIEPSPDHDGYNYGQLDRHPVTGIATRKILNEKESKNQRYGNLSVMLKFKPKTGTWFVAGRNEDGLLTTNIEPHIGIAAVECIGIKPESENKKLNNIGVFLRIGSSLSLYPTPGSIDEQFVQNRIEEQKVLAPIQPVLDEKGTIANPDLFDSEKYAIIHLTNMGSWQEGSWFSNIHRYADQYHAKFVIHAYVLGEWEVRPVAISEPESRPPFTMKKAGFKDFLLPDFNLGRLGRLISGAGWLLVLFAALCFGFPSLRMFIINMMKRFIKKILAKDSHLF